MAESTVRFDERAALDVRTIVQWYREQRVDLAQSFLVELDHCIARLATHPELYSAAADGLRRALLSRFPFAAYYRLEDDVVVVIAVFHTSRAPEVWKDRLKG